MERNFISYCFLFLFLFFYLNLSGQVSVAQSSRLTIGCQVPDITFLSIKNFNNKTANLYDFKGKFIIVDFWNKSCASCINSFARLEELQEKFSKDIQILLVTNNTVDQLTALFKNSSVLKKIKLPIIMGDSVLSKKWFPYDAVPYQVWIDNNFIVKATTNGWSANENNLKKFIAGVQLDIPIRVDNSNAELDNELTNSHISLLNANQGKYLKYLKYYRALPFFHGFSSVSLRADNILLSSPTDYYHRLICEYLPGFGNAPFNSIPIKDSCGNNIGLRFINKPVTDLYAFAFDDIPGEKIMFDSSCSEFRPPPYENSYEYGKWSIENSYCYELIMPDFNLKKAKAVMKNDLINYFSVGASCENRILSFYTFFREKENKILQNDRHSTFSIFEDMGVRYGYRFNNVPFIGFLNQVKLYNNYLDDAIVSNETGIVNDYLIDFVINSSLHLTDIRFKKELQRYGLGIKEIKKESKVLLLKKLTSDNNF